MVQLSKGLESLVQRGQSHFYLDLVSLFKKSQDAVLEAFKGSSNDIDLILKDIDLAEDLKQLIEKQTNIFFKIIYLEDSLIPNAMAVLSAKRKFGLTSKKKKLTPGQMISEIDQLYDDRSGKALSYMKSSYLEFYFILSTGFWKIKNKQGDFYFTPEEISAIVLHEIGHIDHYIRTYLRVHFQILNAHDIVEYVQLSPDKQVVLALIKRLKESSYLTKDWLPLLNQTENYFLKTNSFDSKKDWEALSVLSMLVTSEISEKNLSSFNESLKHNEKQATTKSMVLDSERSADDFTARHGAYASLVSALTKMHQLDSSKSQYIYNQIIPLHFVFIFSNLTYFSSLFKISSEIVSNGYDPIVKRLSLIVETGKHSFQDNDLPDEIKKSIKEQILQAETYINQYKSTTHHQFRQYLVKWRQTIIDTGKLIGSPFYNPLSDSYNNLQDATRSLSRNRLYYLNNLK